MYSGSHLPEKKRGPLLITPKPVHTIQSSNGPKYIVGK